MQIQRVNLVRVIFVKGCEPMIMGRLALKERKIFFEYDPDFLKLGLQLSPFKLPLKSGVIECADFLFDGLFGVFNDSLPDGWGRLLLDRKLMSLGINPDELTVLDRLRYVGTHGMGALQYEPELETFGETKQIENLDIIAEECVHFFENDDDQYVDELLALNGSSAGARPKILVNLISEKKLIHSDNKTSHPHNDWIIKFQSSLDIKDIGPIEYAYHLMAEAAGLEVPEARLFKSKKGNGYFGVKRFDRIENDFLHMHTVSGLLHADHRIPCLNYETLLKATLWLTKNVDEVEKQFRHAVFNVLAHNRDDHSKNFSFLMNLDGTWKVSPAYDLTFSSGPAGEHCTTVMGEGKKPQVKHLLKLAEISGIKPSCANQIIDEVRMAVSRWVSFADESGVSQKTAKRISKILLK